MLTFARQTLADFHHTGAICASGPRLARAMTQRARRFDGSKRVLEVGPGTGAFTRQLLDTLRDGDSFDIVEINPRFVAHLEEKWLTAYRATHPSRAISVHQVPIEEAPLTGTFDVIVCGLPFNNFPIPMVRRIFDQLSSLLAPSGTLTFFEYAGVRPFRHAVGSRTSRASMRRRTALMQIIGRRYHAERRLVVANLPPAYAIRLRSADESAAPAPSSVR